MVDSAGVLVRSRPPEGEAARRRPTGARLLPTQLHGGAVVGLGVAGAAPGAPRRGPCSRQPGEGHGGDRSQPLDRQLQHPTPLIRRRHRQEDSPPGQRPRRRSSWRPGTGAGPRRGVGGGGVLHPGAQPGGRREGAQGGGEAGRRGGAAGGPFLLHGSLPGDDRRRVSPVGRRRQHYSSSTPAIQLIRIIAWINVCS